MSQDTTIVKVPPPGLDLQVKLLYCEYGWDIPRIAATLNTSVSVIRVSISAQKLEQKQFDTVPVPVGYDEGLVQLKTGEINKQQQLAPLLAVIEISLLQRIMEATETAIEPETISSLVSSFKKLTQDAVINTVVSDEKKNGGAVPQVAVQVINKFE